MSFFGTGCGFAVGRAIANVFARAANSVAAIGAHRTAEQGRAAGFGACGKSGLFGAIRTASHPRILRDRRQPGAAFWGVGINGNVVAFGDTGSCAAIRRAGSRVFIGVANSVPASVGKSIDTAFFAGSPIFSRRTFAKVIFDAHFDAGTFYT